MLVQSNYLAVLLLGCMLELVVVTRQDCPSGCHCPTSLMKCLLTELPERVISALRSAEGNYATLDLDTSRIELIAAGTFCGVDRLERLKLNNNKLEKVGKGRFVGLNSLRCLELGDNAIAGVEAGAFEGLQNLKDLDLYGNRLVNVTSGMFNGLAKLRRLHLDGNAISHLETNAFDGLTSISSLILKNNSLSHIETGVFNGLQNLITLDLAYNKLVSITSGMFTGLKQLQKMKLYNNDISYIEMNNLDGFPLGSLSSLSLQHNSFSYIETGSFNGLQNLGTLNLSFNKLVNITRGMFIGLIHLRNLYLNQNEISYIENNIFKKTNTFNSNGNIYPELETFNDFQCLAYLDLSSNRLTNLSDSVLSGLKQLKKLNLYNNDIKYLEENTFGELGKLEYLDLHQNFISHIKPGTFDKLRNLIYLNLSDNSFTSESMPNRLTPIKPKCQYNANLSIEKSAFDELGRVKTLNLNRNLISSLEPGTFGCLLNLKSLILSNNELTLIKNEVFTGLAHLQNLYLNGNNIYYLGEKAFSALKKLKILFLSSNNLYSLSGNIFSQLSSLEKLVLENNPWDCTCANLYDYQQWSLSTRIPQLYDLQCRTPKSQSLEAADLRPTCFLPIIMSKDNYTKEVNFGENFTLECNATGIPPPDVWWELPLDDADCYQIAGGINHTATAKAAAMVIKNCQRKHLGLYICWANNSLGRDVSYTRVFLFPPADHSAKAIKNLVLAGVCVFFGSVLLLLTLVGVLGRCYKLQGKNQVVTDPRREDYHSYEEIGPELPRRDHSTPPEYHLYSNSINDINEPSEDEEEEESLSINYRENIQRNFISAPTPAIISREINDGQSNRDYQNLDPKLSIGVYINRHSEIEYQNSDSSEEDDNFLS